MPNKLKKETKKLLDKAFDAFNKRHKIDEAIILLKKILYPVGEVLPEPENFVSFLREKMKAMEIDQTAEIIVLELFDEIWQLTDDILKEKTANYRQQAEAYFIKIMLRDWAKIYTKNGMYSDTYRLEALLKRNMLIFQHEVATNTHSARVEFYITHIQESVENWLHEIAQAIKNGTYSLIKNNISLPNELSELGQLAAKSIFLNDYNTALVCCDAIIEKELAPTIQWQTARYQLGEIYVMLNFLDKAEHLYQNIVSNDPDAMDACWKLAEILERQNRLEDAKTYFTRYSQNASIKASDEMLQKCNDKLTKINAKIHKLTGDELVKKGQTNHAVEQYWLASELDKEYLPLYQKTKKKIDIKNAERTAKNKLVEEGNQAFTEKNYEKAIHIFSQILDHDSGDRGIRLQRVRAVRLAGIFSSERFSMAENDCQTLAKSMQNESALRRSEILYEQGALKLWKAQYNSEAIDYSTGLVNVSEYGWAIKDFEKAVELNPNAWESFLAMGKAYHLSTLKFQFLIDNAIVDNELLEALEANRDMLCSEAKIKYVQAHIINKNCFEAYWAIAEMFEAKHDYGIAINYYLAIEHLTSCKKARLKSAEMETKLGNHANALVTYQELFHNEMFNSIVASKVKFYFDMAISAKATGNYHLATQQWLLALCASHEKTPYDMVTSPIVLMTSSDTDVPKTLILDKKCYDKPILLKTANAFYLYGSTDGGLEWKLVSLGDMHPILYKYGINFPQPGGTIVLQRSYPEIVEYIMLNNAHSFASDGIESIHKQLEALTKIPDVDFKSCAVESFSNESYSLGYLQWILSDLEKKNYQGAVEKFEYIKESALIIEDAEFLVKMAEAYTRGPKKNLEQALELYEFALDCRPEDETIMAAIQKLEKLKALRNQGIFKDSSNNMDSLNSNISSNFTAGCPLI